jgi:4-diphosphocytidyl-2-C-methyl-D-erythritol kinase
MRFAYLTVIEKPCILDFAMVDSCKVLASAKVNIGLNVLPLARPCGYHNIESVFQSVALCDELIVECARKNAGFELECLNMDLPKENTISAAYAAFCDEALDGSPGIRVTLKKRIPSGAGLGGGSSDAASLVFALEKIFDVSLNVDAKKRIASRVGSDVFFFLLAGHQDKGAFAAVVTGRGERVKSIEARRDIFFVLVCPHSAVLTREAYGALDEWRVQNGQDAPPVPLDELEAMYYADVESWRFTNSFTPQVLRLLPEVARALNDVRGTGALFAAMSGSGSAVYGVYQSKESANAAYLRLNKDWEQCYVC